MPYSHHPFPLAHTCPLPTHVARFPAPASGGQRSFNVASFERCLVPSVRGVGWDVTANRVVIGTAGSEIYEVSSLNGMDCNGGPVIQGHFQGQTWGLDCHPTKVRPNPLRCAVLCCACAVLCCAVLCLCCAGGVSSLRAFVYVYLLNRLRMCNR